MRNNNLVRKIFSSIRRNGIISSISMGIIYTIGRLRWRFYFWNGDDFGIKEALFWPRGIDEWQRYSKVMENLPLEEKFSLLDVGSGKEGIAAFLHYARRFCEKYQLTLLDIDGTRFENTKLKLPNVEKVVADGCNLPFKKDSFDIVISVDSAEHVPQHLRSEYFSEIKRVTNGKVIVHCPVESEDGTFVGRQSDFQFQQSYIDMFGEEDANTAEHIEAGHPTLRELRECFPGAEIRGIQNTSIWLKHMLLSRRPLLGLCTGLLYCLVWQRYEDKSSYHGALLVWNKDDGS